MDTPVCDIKLKGERIEIVKEKKLLGITIDDQLKFEEHIADTKEAERFQGYQRHRRLNTR